MTEPEAAAAPDLATLTKQNSMGFIIQKLEEIKKIQMRKVEAV
jgi:hypothetical protein